jgi:hypothetical protein
MGKAGRRKRDDLAYETFDGAGCSSGLQFELASGNGSGYAGVFPTTSGRWQATVRVEREGKKVRRNVGSFNVWRRRRRCSERSLCRATRTCSALCASRWARQMYTHLTKASLCTVLVLTYGICSSCVYGVFQHHHATRAT